MRGAVNQLNESQWRRLNGTYCYRVHSHNDGTEHKAWLQVQLKGPHGTEGGGRKQSGPCRLQSAHISFIFSYSQCINLLVSVAKNKILKIRIISKSHRFIWFLFSSKQNLYLKPAAYTCKCEGWRKHIINIGKFTEFFQQISWMIDQFLLCMVTYQLGSSLALCPENQWYFYSTTYKVNLFHNHPLFMSYFIPLFHQTVPLSWCKCSVLKELVL